MLGLLDSSVAFPRGDNPGRITNSPCPEVGAGHMQSPKAEGGTCPAGSSVLVLCDPPQLLTRERSQCT
jgi:hypothetical protein